MKLLLFLLVFTLNAHATEAHDYLERLERMVAAQVITPEAAQKEKLHIKSSENKQAVRGKAQRDLASVNPALKPLSIKRYRAIPMEFVLD